MVHKIVSEGIFAGGGEVGALMASFSWADTPFGPVGKWPMSLKTAVSICVNSRFPMVLWWGPDFRLLYNDAFLPILGDRHPQALAQPAQQVFAESWHIIGPQLENVWATKQADRVEDLLIPVKRSGYVEESYYTYSYSPMLLESGEVGGVFTAIIESTKQILSERRLALLTALSAQPDEAAVVDEIYYETVATLASNAADIPFAGLYRLNTAKTKAVLCGKTPDNIDVEVLPKLIDIERADPWSFEWVLHTNKGVTIEDVSARLGDFLPSGMFDLPVTSVRVLPVRAAGRKAIVALLVLGMSPALEFDLTYSSFFDAIAAYLNTAIANSSRQQTEAALKISKGRLKSFVEANVVGILFGDVYDAINEANDEFLRIIGYSREDLQAGSIRWTEITPPEWLPLDEKGIAEARATGACTPYEKEYIRKDGSRVQVLVGYSLLGEAREESVAFVLDISDRKRIEQSLKQRETELSLVTNAVPVLISFVDAERRYRFNNKGYEEWFDCSAADLYGKHLSEVLGETGYQMVLPYVERVFAGEQVTFENQLPNAAGDRRYVSATFVPRFVESGAVEGFVVLVTDITGRKQTEIEREQLLERELMAREAAERANRIKDEFLAVISHELRTPMNPILGWSQLLRRGRLKEKKVAVALETIERNAKLQVQLIDDLLDISRILRGKMSLAQSPTDLSEVIAAAMETVRLAAEAKGIVIEPSLSPCWVMGDAGRLQQVVWNLLANAVKFTPEGGEVRVDLQAQERDAQITVSDTGQGISADFLPYVFEHFRQEDYSMTRQFGGLGLGLAIARQLVELHGGRITAESEGESKGATFRVQIPLAVPPQARLDSNLNRSGENDLSDLDILIVDDEPDSLTITAFALEEAGATVTAVTSGAEALTAIARSVPDLIVSDVGMPDMDGCALIKQIRALPSDAGGEISAIALTAYAAELDYKRAIAAGFQKHVAKPVDPDRLVEIVCELCQSGAQC